MTLKIKPINRLNLGMSQYLIVKSEDYVALDSLMNSTEIVCDISKSSCIYFLIL